MQPTMMLPKLTDTTQTISFSEDDDVCSAEVYANNVVVTTSTGNHNHGSSKVKLKNLVDYNWEPKFYPGQLLAIHMSGQYLAYSIKAPNALNPGTWSGMVRVVYSPEPGSDRRTLIKGMHGEVQDLAFSYIQNRVVLACIDEHGNYYVHEITPTETGLRCTLLAEVREDTGAGAGGSHRVVWCPYIPDEEDDAADDVAWLLLTTHDNIARIWNVSTVQSRLEQLDAAERSAAASQLLAGAQAEAEVEAEAEAEKEAGAAAGGVAAGEHAAPIVHAAFSPDGTALATASADGYVMFFQVYAHSSGAPRCLHKWQPHGGKPLSCLFFLDDHKNYNIDVQFWKFAVTGAESNTCIKIWSCKSWSCLQTVTFAPAPGAAPAPAHPLGLKAMLDSSARYLVVSGGRARSLYVLRVARDAADRAASCTALAEFLLPYPVLSFCILAAEEEEVRCDSGLDEPYLSDGDRPASPLDPLRDELDGDSARGSAGGAAARARVRLRLYIVHPKGLQEGELVYAQPPPAAARARADPHTPPATRHGVSEAELELEAEAGVGAAVGAGVGASVGEAVGSPPTYEALLEQQSEQLKSLLMRSQPSMLVAPAPGAGDAPPAAGAAPPPPPLTLMTPDAFSSTVPQQEEEPRALSAKPELPQAPMAPLAPLAPLVPLAPLAPLRSSTAGSAEGGAGGGGGEGALQPSGGSSPSREVQQIMAHDAPYYKEHMDDDDDEEEEEEEDDGAGGAVPEAAEGGREAAPRLNGAPPPLNHSIADGGESSWPPMAAAQLAEAHRQAAGGERAPSGGGGGGGGGPLRAEPERLLRAEAEARDLRERLREAHEQRARLDDRLDSLAEAVDTCLHEVRALRGALGGQRDAAEQALRAHAQRTAQALDDAINAGWERVGRVGEVAAARAGTAAGTGAARALEPLAAALQHELAAKLSATDRLLRENIEKLATSKTVLECLSATVGGALADTLRRTFRDALLDNAMPVMEKALAQMFRQLNAAFQAGTKEFAANAESAARAAAERGGAAQAAALGAALERHEAALARHEAALRAHAAQPAPPAQPAQPAQPDLQLHAAAFMQMAHNLLEKEMVWWREHLLQLVVSRAQTPALPAPGPAPAPSAAALDRQIQMGQVQSLIARGEVNAGFQMALSAADLALVVAACRAADPARVFQPPCALKQNVLMSLVQQLAADMATDTDLKHKYLEEAILNLDLTDPVTRQHMPSIIRELQKQIAAYLSTGPDHVRAKQFRMLAMVADSLMHKV